MDRVLDDLILDCARDDDHTIEVADDEVAGVDLGWGSPSRAVKVYLTCIPALNRGA